MQVLVCNQLFPGKGFDEGPNRIPPTSAFGLRAVLPFARPGLARLARVDQALRCSLRLPGPDVFPTRPISPGSCVF